jgi:hypothetical protein
MYFSYYPVLPSLGFSITFVIAGLVSTLINLNVLRTGWKKNLKLDLVLGTLGLFFSVPLTVSPLLSWCYRIDLPGLAKPIFGLLGFFMYFFALVRMYRTRNDSGTPWGPMWQMLIATALMIMPWFIGLQTDSY